jgi:hypothetical protein
VASPSTSSAGESDFRARTTRGVLVWRDRDKPAAAPDAAVRRCPPPARLGRAIAECGPHMARSSRAIASRRLQHSMLPIGAVLRQLGWGERLQCADGTWCARLARSRRAGGGTRCCRAALSSASSAGSATAERGRRVASLSRTIATRRRQHPMLPCGVALCQHIWEGACRAYTAHGVLVSRDCDAQAFALSASCGTALRQLGWGGCVESADGTCQWRDHLARSRHASVALGAALRRYPPPVLLGRATAESGRHMVCSSRVIATRQGSTRCCRAALPSASLAGSHGVLAERGQHLACSSRVIAMRLRQPPKLPYGVALRKLSRGERLQSADDTWRVCLAQPRNAGCST